MQVGDAAAWFAVAVALITAVIALGNARSAKRQASAAEAGVKEAERSAEAAETQAEAARAQVELMREQLALAQSERMDRERLDQRQSLVEVINTGRKWVPAAESAATTLGMLSMLEARDSSAVENYGLAVTAFKQALVHASLAVTDPEMAPLVAQLVRVRALMVERFDGIHSGPRDSQGYVTSGPMSKALAVPRLIEQTLDKLEQLAIQRFAYKQAESTPVGAHTESTAAARTP